MHAQSVRSEWSHLRTFRDDRAPTITATFAPEPPPCPTITLASLSNGILGTAYTGAATASGAPPYTYALTSGALPTGLSLVASDPGAGGVTGTPTATGTFAFDHRYGHRGAGTCAGSRELQRADRFRVAAGDLVIREFRSRGRRAEDEYVEVVNNPEGTLTIATDGSAGFGIVGSDGTCPAGAGALLAAIPNGTVIPWGGTS